MLLGYNDGTGNNPFIVYIRFGAAPTDDIHDVVQYPVHPTDKQIDAIYSNPGAGYLVIGIVNNNDTQISTQIGISPVVCENNQTGVSCNISVEVVEVNSYSGTKQLGPLSWTYYVIDLTTTPSFYVGSIDSNTNAPDAYARIINFPTTSLFDMWVRGNRVNILSSQQKTSYYVHVIGSIYYPVTRTLADATKWYVGVYNPSNDSSLSYGTWANTPCPNDCNNQGTCQDNVCQCNSGFSGFACEVEEEGGFKVEYIILIVVGAAIVVSAIIGIIVWAVKKRKRNAYESF